MQIKNDYQAQWDRDDGTSGCGIYNGDIGIVTKITSSNLEVSFDGRKVSYKRNTLDQLELAYAITIHKSQGSEFDVVIMPMLNNFRQLSYRNLLYTGVTRAKKLLVIVGSRNELFAMVDNNKQILRYSNLKQLIQKNFDEEI
jgi:exodeoxyribonuclease V alpha subunit